MRATVRYHFTPNEKAITRKEIITSTGEVP